MTESIEIVAAGKRIVISMPLEAAEEIVYCFEEGQPVTNPALAEKIHEAINAAKTNVPYFQSYLEKS